MGEKIAVGRANRTNYVQAAHCKTHVRSLLMALFASGQASERGDHRQNCALGVPGACSASKAAAGGATNLFAQRSNTTSMRTREFLKHHTLSILRARGMDEESMEDEI